MTSACTAQRCFAGPPHDGLKLRDSGLAARRWTSGSPVERAYVVINSFIPSVFGNVPKCFLRKGLQRLSQVIGEFGGN